MKNCIFCQIVDSKSPAHKIWEDKNHLAFLSIYPNTSPDFRAFLNFRFFTG